MLRMFMLAITLGSLLAVFACSQPQIQRCCDHPNRPPELNPDYAVMADGYRLTLSIHPATGAPRALLLALHGFNDYRNAFAGPAEYFAQHGITTIAYDQRGFGATAQRGIWAGSDVMRHDAVTMAQLLCRQYPHVPLYLLGESMGGAVVIESLQAELPDCVAGAVLVAPAVWGWDTMPWWQGFALRFAVHLMPAKTLTGKGLKISPSDNVEMLRALGRDPLIIKATRIDTIYGLTNLMQSAAERAGSLELPVLLLYGAHDEIIPVSAMCPFQQPFLVTSSLHEMALYEQGFHMLTRDLQAIRVLQDIVAWVLRRPADLPSGEQVLAGSERLQQLCK